jgi:hypothetical protein
MAATGNTVGAQAETSSVICVETVRHFSPLTSTTDHLA